MPTVQCRRADGPGERRADRRRPRLQGGGGIAPFILPSTGSKYGRPGKRTSHYLYTCPDPDPKAWIKWLDEKKACIVELRLGGGGKGAQSVMPGSVHISGEQYEWETDDERATVSCAELKAAVVKIAIGTLLVRHWPALGSRHDTALALGGFLARAGWTADEVEYFVTAICKAHGEATIPRNMARPHATASSITQPAGMLTVCRR